MAKERKLKRQRREIRAKKSKGTDRKCEKVRGEKITEKDRKETSNKRASEVETSEEGSAYSRKNEKRLADDAI